MTGDLRVESRIVAGPPRRALVQACADDADVMVMGSRAYGPMRSVLLGSVSRRVVDDAPCPVIIVPRGARTDLGSVPETVAAAPSPT
jgi:nucleotide-binding universal stress UspA family protein